MSKTEAPEEWHAVVGWEGVYEVTREGAIRSLDRIVQTSTGPRNLKGGPKKPTVIEGYPMVNLRDGSRPQKVKSVHRILAEAFIPNPSGLPEVNHIDGDKGNYSLSNLEWVTPSGNRQHAWDTGLIKSIPSSVGEDHPNAILNEKKVVAIRESKAAGVPTKEIARAFGINRKTVNAVAAGRAWRHVSLPSEPAKGGGNGG